MPKRNQKMRKEAQKSRNIKRLQQHQFERHLWTGTQPKRLELRDTSMQVSALTISSKSRRVLIPRKIFSTKGELVYFIKTIYVRKGQVFYALIATKAVSSCAVGTQRTP